MVTALGRIVFTWGLDILYLIIYVLTFGRVTIHEGTFFKLFYTYVTWNFDYFGRPSDYATPSEESEIVDLVKNALRVRVVGGGHSFNTGTISDNVMISLDKYNKILQIHHDTMRVRVQAGIRLRDFMVQIENEGLSLPTLGSTNAQSLGGLIATDLHGTTKVNDEMRGGFLSEQVEWIKIIDAKGTIHKLERGKDDEELFAVTGGIGALGVVIELEIQCVPKYRLEKKITIVDRQIVHDNIQQFLGYNDHLSFYYIGGTTLKSCRMNTWNETVNDESFLYRLRHFLQEIFDFILCGFILGIGRFTQKLDVFGPFGMLIMKIFMNRSLTTVASQSFSRQLFYRHDEIEYGIPQEKFNQAIEELLELLKTNHNYVTIIEVRFAGMSHSLLGPGSGRKTVFIELAPSLSIDPTPLFSDAERLFKRLGGKPHLGKWTTATPAYMREVHGDNFAKFQEIRRRFDPHGKFTNEFVTQVFGPVGPAPLITASGSSAFRSSAFESDNDER